MLRRSRAQLNLYTPLPVPDEKVDGHPSFTSSRHHNIGSWPHKVTFACFGAALRLPSRYRPSLTSSRRTSYNALVITKPTISVAGIPFNSTIGSNYEQDIVNYTQNAADASMLANVNLPTLDSTLHV